MVITGHVFDLEMVICCVFDLEQIEEVVTCKVMIVVLGMAISL